MRRIRPYRHVGVLSLLCFLISSCATAPISQMTGDRIVLTELCRKYDINWKWDSVSQVVHLQKGTHVVKVLVGSTAVVLDGERIMLNARIQRKAGIITVPRDFKEKVIARFSAEPARKRSAFKRIALDAGHGGKDPGAISMSGIEEKIVNLDIARRLKDILEQHGVTVIMTRDSDVFIPLEERSRIAHREKADVFISIHANANPSYRLRGLEVYYLRDRDVPKHQHDMQHYRSFFNTLSMRNEKLLKRIILDMMYSRKQAISRGLADSLSKNVARDIRTQNRGCFAAGYNVLRNTAIPAVLVEVGYLSNREEARKLASSAYRQDIADALAEALIQYGK